MCEAQKGLVSLDSQGGLCGAAVRCVAGKALAHTRVGVADASVGAGGHVLVGGLHGGEELVHVEHGLAVGVVDVGTLEVAHRGGPVGGQVCVDEVRLVVQDLLAAHRVRARLAPAPRHRDRTGIDDVGDGGEAVTDGVLVLASVQALCGVHVDVSGVVLGHLPVDQREHVGLVQAVVDEAQLGGVVVAHLAGDVTVELGGLVEALQVVGDVGHVHVLGGEPEGGLGLVGGQRQGALGGVDIVVVGDEVVGGSEGVEQLEGAVGGARVVKGLSGVVPEDCEVPPVRVGGHGAHQLDHMGVQLGPLVPVVDVDVVGCVEVPGAQALLQQVLLSSGHAGQEGGGGVLYVHSIAGLDLAFRVADAGSDAVAVVGEVVVVLSLLPVRPHLGDHLAPRGHERGPLAVKVQLDLRGLDLSRVSVELHAVDVATDGLRVLRVVGAHEGCGGGEGGDLPLVVGGLSLPQGHLVDDSVGVGAAVGVVHVERSCAAVAAACEGEGALLLVVDGGLGAGQRGGGDDIVGQAVQGRHHGLARGVARDRVCDPVLAGVVEVPDGPVARVRHGLPVGEHRSPIGGDRGAHGGGGEGGEVEDGVLDGGHVVQVQGVHAVLAGAQRAVRAGVALVALAAHGGVLVPQLVHVAVVCGGELLDGLAHAVSGAGRGVAGARGALAGDPVVALEALALARGAVALALVGALHVVVRRVLQLVQV
mmetsp:Transcript_14828/g.32452  ORF Transcript_14828/g.32452 Transcript_14828/m.32452 type:complete len:703 (+) Transcript_14828:240-2348(+)